MTDIVQIAKKLASDVYSGSSTIVTEFLSALAESEFTRSQFEEAFAILRKAHPEMAVIENAHRVLSRVPDDGLQVAAQGYLKSLQEAPLKIAEHLLTRLTNNAILMTFSQSKTVAEVFIELHRNGKLGGVVLAESRPAMEGRNLAEFLARQGISVTLTVDCALGALMEGVDMVVVGADAVTDEYIVNKVGTLALVLMANYHGKPVYSLASTHKLVPKSEIQKFAGKDEIWSQAPEGVVVQAPLFERVPLALLGGVISERGFMGIQEIEIILE